MHFKGGFPFVFNVLFCNFLAGILQGVSNSGEGAGLSERFEIDG